MNCEKIKQNVSIRSVLESFKLFPVKENRRTAFYFALDRKEKIPSLCVDYSKNSAFDFGTGKSYDVISVVQQIKKCSVSEALKYLSSFNFPAKAEYVTEETQSEISYRILKITEIRHPALIQYLESRKVYEQKECVCEVHYEVDGRKYFGIGFKNDSGGFEIRNKYAKVCLGLKDITLINNSNNVTNEVAVFEGFFDYLSFRNLENKFNLECDFLILNSTAMLFKAQKKLNEYQKILLFLDNDDNGNFVASKIKKEYTNVEDCSLMYYDFKDMNDWFVKNANSLNDF
ncbi:toprim domain-containing protein [Chryseobacterium indologenes]|uniref:toprim domain-containing protein n=1 Tax=Chryseobacterium indologenes TaxID=253 RepID=UPI002574D709|nr:toprim domain-containing protein [Chryseobacterium indologenes]MDM1556132.1 toprim domain-containing protein [Chryseobacterium indologenes]